MSEQHEHSVGAAPSAFVLVPSGAFDELKQMVAQLVTRAPAPAVDLPALGLDPMRAYSAKEVADILGIKRVASVYEIPDDELPRVKRVGTSIGFLGINVLCYMHGLPPVDVAAAVEAYRQRLIQDRPSVKPLRVADGGKTRLY